MSGRTHVVIAGAGPAGIAAAVRASAAGAAVTVIDDNPAPGGQIWRGGSGAHGGPAGRWLAALRDASVPVLAGARVISADPAGKSVLVETAGGARTLQFDSLIVATGAREIFLPFPGWTLPGVTGAGGLQALIQSGLPVLGKRVVMAGSGPLLLAAAQFCRSRGARVLAVVEQASARAIGSFAFHLAATPGKLWQAAQLRASLAGVPYRTDSWVAAAEGDGRLERVRIRCGGATFTEECDYAAVGYGLFPNTEVALLLGCRVAPEGVVTDDAQETSVRSVYCAGECAGVAGVELSLIEGEIAGYAAAGARERARTLLPARARARRFAARLSSAFALRPELMKLAAADTIVCRCEDVRLASLRAYTTFRAARLHTRCGMGPCQGRICGTAAHFLLGWTDGSVRPPVFPASIGALAVDEGSISKEALETL